MKIGIVGCGVVGTAVAKSAVGCDLSIFDKYDNKKNRNMDEFNETEICFVSVPTPSTLKGQDLTELHAALHGLMDRDYKGVVIVKCTVLPGTMDKFKEEFPSLRLVHNPEFLTEKNASQEFIDQKVILLSGKFEDTHYADKFYCHKRFVHLEKVIHSQKYQTTEFAKYIHNCFLSVKISFLNEIYDMCDGNQVLFDQAVEMAATQGKLGRGHLKVPGPDGKRGFGGMCFVKDTMALLKFADDKGHTVTTLHGAIKKNLMLRHTAYDGTEKTGFSVEEKEK